MGNLLGFCAHSRSASLYKSQALELQYSLRNFNLYSILDTINNFDLNSSDSSKLSQLKAIKSELRNLNTNSFNYATYILKNSDQFLIDLLCSTCFKPSEQFELVQIYIQVSKLDRNAYEKINLDDLILSCLDAYSPRVSHLILDEYLLNNSHLNQNLFAMEKNQIIENSTVLEIAIKRFKVYVGGLKVAYETNRLNENTVTNLFEFQNFILKLQNSGFKLNDCNSSDLYEYIILPLLINYNECDLILYDSKDKSIKLDSYISKLNELLTFFIYRLLDFDPIRLTSWSFLNHFYNSYGFKSIYSFNELRVYVKTLFYYKIKKSKFKNINFTNNHLLIKMLSDEKIPFNPLRLSELVRKNLNLNRNEIQFQKLPNKIKNFLNYSEEPVDLLLYFI
jgi:hypothetical protein